MVKFWPPLLCIFGYSTHAAVFTSPVVDNVENLMSLLSRDDPAESRPFHEVLE